MKYGHYGLYIIAIITHSSCSVLVKTTLQAMSAAIRDGDHKQLKSLFSTCSFEQVHVLETKKPLFAMALWGNNIKVIKVLLEAGCNPCVQFKHQDPPLAMAIKRRKYEFAELLVQAGAFIESEEQLLYYLKTYIPRAERYRWQELLSNKFCTVPGR